MAKLISPAELHDLLVRKAPVTVVDVRPRKAFLEGHIAGAVSIPRAEIKERLGEVPKSGPVFTY